MKTENLIPVNRLIRGHKYFLISDTFKLYCISINAHNDGTIVYPYNDSLIQSHRVLQLKNIQSDNSCNIYNPYGAVSLGHYKIFMKQNINLYMDEILKQLEILKSEFTIDDILGVLEDIGESLKIHKLTVKKYIRLLTEKLCE